MGVFPAASITGQLELPSVINRFHLPNHMEHHVNVNDEIEALETWGYDSAGLTTFTVGTCSQGATLTKTTNWAQYRRFGRLAEIWLSVTFTSSGTNGQAIAIALPDPLKFTLYSSNCPIGTSYIEDAGVSGFWSYVVAAGVDTIAFIDPRNYGYVGNTYAWQVGNGDYCTAHFWSWIQG